MRICIVGPSMRFTSGVSYYTTYLANSLSLNNEVSVISFRNILPKFAYPGKVRVGKKVTDLEFNNSIKIQEMDYNKPVTWVKSYEHIKQFKPDVIVLQWWSASVAHMHLLIKLFSKIVGAKVVIEFHEVVDPYENSVMPIKLYAKLAGKLLRTGVAACIAHSESDKKLIVERYGILTDKIKVVPIGLYDNYYAIDKETITEVLLISEEYTILAFGLIRRYKGIKYLIDAFERLPFDLLVKSRLMIVGEIWEDKEELYEQLRWSPARSKITLIDEYVHDRDISKYFSAADVVVLPYTRSSQSAVAAIALAFGKPIIASEVGGLKESLCDYKGTYFVEPKDIEGLKNKLIYVSNNCKTYEPPKRSFEDVSSEYIKVLV